MKNKKGFTLIELLAVLVVLAIIALIAIPIVVNIISDARANSNRRSVDNYGKAIEYAVSRYMNTEQYQANSFGKEISFDDVKQFVDYRGKEINCKVIIDKFGGVTLEECYIGNSRSCVLKESSKKMESASDCYVYKTEQKVNSTSGLSNDINGDSSNNGNSIRDNNSSPIDYKIGDPITLNDGSYYVINNSHTNEDYVTIIKKDVLTKNELQQYGNGLLNSSGTVSYCNEKNCSSNYSSSNVRQVVDNWAESKFTNGELKKIDGYKARLITFDELKNNFNFTYRQYATSYTYESLSAPNWIYDSYCYWTMSLYDNDDSIAIVSGYRAVVGQSMDSRSCDVRPVINVYKSKLSN